MNERQRYELSELYHRVSAVAMEVDRIRPVRDGDIIAHAFRDLDKALGVVYDAIERTFGDPDLILGINEIRHLREGEMGR